MIAAVCFPCAVAGGASGAYYYQMHRLCESMSVAALPPAPLTSHTRRFLILSPHCDDETLGLGGVIASARRRGSAVQVAFLTNGDGFRVAASRALGEPLVGPSDFVRFAGLRQKESIAALSELGVAESNIKFLGYPDRGLQPMWETNWSETRPFRSGFTGHTHSPYARAFTPHATYCGTSLVRDLTRVMHDYAPTDIFVTHPSDDHTDHFIAAAYAEAALRACQASGDSWAQTAHLRYYIVHRGDWPLPQNSHPDRPLSPPPGLVSLDTHWSAFALTPDAETAKSKALEHYQSQLAITARFLHSFVRTNELVGDLPILPINGLRTTTGPALAPDAAGDNVARFADAAADLTGVSAARDGDTLRVRVSVRGRVSPRVLYRVSVRANADTNTSRFVSFGLATRSVTPDGKTLEVKVPLSALSSDANQTATRFWVCAETRWAATPAVSGPVDRTGYRVFVLPATTPQK